MSAYTLNCTKRRQSYANASVVWPWQVLSLDYETIVMLCGCIGIFSTFSAASKKGVISVRVISCVAGSPVPNPPPSTMESQQPPARLAQHLVHHGNHILCVDSAPNGSKSVHFANSTVCFRLQAPPLVTPTSVAPTAHGKALPLPFPRAARWLRVTISEANRR
jgi:hypothetical protein